jgi:hypothetical protein
VREVDHERHTVTRAQGSDTARGDDVVDDGRTRADAKHLSSGLLFSSSLL